MNKFLRSTNMSHICLETPNTIHSLHSTNNTNKSEIVPFITNASVFLYQRTPFIIPTTCTVLIRVKTKINDHFQNVSGPSEPQQEEDNIYSKRNYNCKTLIFTLFGL